jgi:hypothetical protein
MTESKIEHELKLLRAEMKQLNLSAKIIDGWLPRKSVMKFFDLGDTSMASLEKTGKVRYSKVGRNKFYDVNSIKTLLENHVISK